ncbi:MAG: hypothetical protein GF416_03780 [Candidatus Altiarchaeales archaeon]|nr:hypothetical protein [Candidatus Altiarchaeales archaeon]MBD3416239.1 hypothetical protein [Candidatus Altiarchaeales archaeon]
MKRLAAVAVSLILLAVLVTAWSSNPLQNAIKITSCLLNLVNDIMPYVMLALFLIGGITYLTAADNAKQRILGKKYFTFGLVGFICVKALILIAAQPPFDIQLSYCELLGDSPPSSGGGLARYLIHPPDREVLGAASSGTGSPPATPLPGGTGVVQLSPTPGQVIS